MTGKWSGRERVLAALAHEQPDRVPYCELGVDRALAARFGPLLASLLDAGG